MLVPTKTLGSANGSEESWVSPSPAQYAKMLLRPTAPVSSASGTTLSRHFAPQNKVGFRSLFGA